MTPPRQATAARRTRLSVRQQSSARSITPTRSRSGRIHQQSKSRKNKQRETDSNEDLEAPTENDASETATSTNTRSSLRTRSQANVGPRTRNGRSLNHSDEDHPIDGGDEDHPIDGGDEDLPIDGGDEDHPGDNNDQLQIITPDSIQFLEDTNMDDQVSEAIDDLLEDQNPPATSNSINYSEHYVVLSDDELDLVYIPSDDEEDFRINEAVGILEGNLSLNALSSPSTSPRASNPINDTIDLTSSPAPPSFPTLADSPGPSTPSSPGLSLVRIKCPICFDSLVQIKSSGKRLMSTICGHIFCSSCLPACIKTTKNCPTCRKTLKIKDMHPIFF